MLSMVLAHESAPNSAPHRDFHLYDTFAGMSEAGAEDIDLHGRHAVHMLAQEGSNVRCDGAPLAGVQVMFQNELRSTAALHYHVGDVRHADFFPEKIAVLRLDTDYYDSTRFELEHLYDRIPSGGFIIIDDYGHWQGCKKAVDEFWLARNLPPLIGIDYTGVYMQVP